ncbi:DUF7619 domain-containing protein [Flavobacterium wongokense]|uniref:DUF7619 domain-containing protein n=1 Tax=Flavobacterium wongokense TaxID=2910674 RepID=UPI001F42BF9C|nr:T9SS type A sorting domain-containing protein [Flavobacterium sp. WG47]MCF6133391.1 T9SS type A sorting domain-containing protein [Flavobacterium sp. WG47]
MKNIYTAILLLIINLSASAQIVNIPDANFKAKLLSSSTTNTVAQDASDANIKIDANNNGEIEVSEALAVRKLFYTNDGPPPFKMNIGQTVQTIGPISDLTGIAAFTNLEYLYVGSNELTTLDLSSNTLLQYLYCGNNQLTSINLTGLVNLTYLNIRNNNFTSFSTAGLQALVIFDCRANEFLQSLTFNNNPALTHVTCSVCQLSSLDVSSLTGLRNLECSVNNINSLNFGSINQLSELGCSSNQLTTLDISSQTQLKRLNCSNNVLTSNFDFSNLPEIMYVSCSFNSITSLLFANNLHLISVGCTNNNLTSLDFSSTSLYQLYANNNPNLAYVNVKNGIITPDIYVSQFPEPPFTSDNFQLQNTDLNYICHDDGEFGVELIANEGLENVSRGTYCSFTPGGDYNTISGNVTFDCGGANLPMANQNVNVTSNASSGSTFANANGVYQFYTNGAPVTVAPQFSNPNYFTVTPPNYTFNFTDFGNNETANFCLSANGIHPDLEVSILPLTPARPGFDARYKIVFANKGNQLQFGSVSLSFDARMEFVSAVPAVDLQADHNLTWNFTNLVPFQSREIEVTLNVNSPTETPPVNINDILLLTATISSQQTDETPNNNLMSYNQFVVGSFDPNDKETVTSRYIPFDHLNDYIHYIIRFQNTGSAEAENVVIRDDLDSNLDWNTLQMVSSSHPYRSTLTSGNKLEVFYEGINLPAASVNEPASHGYIAFKIKPKSTLVFGDVIENKANIYFDFNFPIITNTVTTRITVVLGNSNSEAALFTMYPNPTSGILNIQMMNNQTITKIMVNNVLGQTIMTSQNASILDISPLTKGTYFVTVTTENGSETKKIIKL